MLDVYMLQREWFWKLEEQMMFVAIENNIDVENCECWCPDAYRDHAFTIEYCPRHGIYCPLDLKPNWDWWSENT